MAISGAIDSNGRFTAEYAAYTKLALVNRHVNELRGDGYSTKKSITFEQFMNAIKDNHVVSEKYVRTLPASEKRDSQINAQHNGNYGFEKERLSDIEKAYSLGLVGYDGVLISSFEARA